MPLMLSRRRAGSLARAGLPHPQDRRPEFLSAVTTRLEAAGPAAVGPGAVHRAAREILGGFWSPPPDLRQNRVAKEGRENA